MPLVSERWKLPSNTNHSARLSLEHTSASLLRALLKLQIQTPVHPTHKPVAMAPSSRTRFHGEELELIPYYTYNSVTSRKPDNSDRQRARVIPSNENTFTLEIDFWPTSSKLDNLKGLGKACTRRNFFSKCSQTHKTAILI